MVIIKKFKIKLITTYNKVKSIYKVLQVLIFQNISYLLCYTPEQFQFTTLFYFLAIFRGQKFFIPEYLRRKSRILLCILQI